MFKEKDLLEQAINCPTMYFDGFGAFRNINGIFRTIGFVFGSGAQLNLIISRAGAEGGTREMRRMLDEDQVGVVETRSGLSLAH